MENLYISVYPKVIETSNFVSIKKKEPNECCSWGNKKWLCNKVFLFVGLIFKSLLFEIINYLEIISYIQEVEVDHKTEKLNWLIPCMH